MFSKKAQLFNPFQKRMKEKDFVKTANLNYEYNEQPDPVRVAIDIQNSLAPKYDPANYFNSFDYVKNNVPLGNKVYGGEISAQQDLQKQVLQSFKIGKIQDLEDRSFLTEQQQRLQRDVDAGRIQPADMVNEMDRLIRDRKGRRALQSRLFPSDTTGMTRERSSALESDLAGFRRVRQVAGAGGGGGASGSGVPSGSGSGVPSGSGSGVPSITSQGLNVHAPSAQPPNLSQFPVIQKVKQPPTGALPTPSGQSVTTLTQQSPTTTTTTTSQSSQPPPPPPSSSVSASQLSFASAQSQLPTSVSGVSQSMVSAQTALPSTVGDAQQTGPQVGEKPDQSGQPSSQGVKTQQQDLVNVLLEAERIRRDKASVAKLNEYEVDRLDEAFKEKDADPQFFVDLGVGISKSMKAHGIKEQEIKQSFADYFNNKYFSQTGTLPNAKIVADAKSIGENRGNFGELFRTSTNRHYYTVVPNVSTKGKVTFVRLNLTAQFKAAP